MTDNKNYGIGGTGVGSEIDIKNILEDSIKNPKLDKGDIIWKEFLIEVKGPRDKSTCSDSMKLNQIRPLKRNILIADIRHLDRYKGMCDFLVFPVISLIELALVRLGGQHTPDAMGSMGMEANMNDFKYFGCMEKDLPDKIKEAYEKDKKYEDFINSTINTVNKFYEILLRWELKKCKELDLSERIYYSKRDEILTN